jgi:hypothetical protein
VPRPDQAARDRVGQLVRDLNAPDFKTRERASRALGAMGESALPVLRGKLAEDLAPEVRRRLRQLVEAYNRPAGERLRALRALEVLELARTAASGRILEELAAGQPGAWMTQQARAALRRLARGPGVP